VKYPLQGTRHKALFTAILLTGLLTGCGFQPLYSKKAATDNSKVFAGVTVDSMPGRSGQLFQAELEDQLNPHGAIPPKPAYRLSATFKTRVVPIGVARDGTVSRYNIYLSSSYTLYRNSDGKPITDGSVSFVNSYNNLTNAYFSTYISEQDALKRGVEELAQLYRQRLTAYFDAGAPVHEIIAPENKKPTSTIEPVPYNTIPGAAPASQPRP